jgi:hypothetical protein
MIHFQDSLLFTKERDKNNSSLRTELNKRFILSVLAKSLTLKEAKFIFILLLKH